MKTYRSFIIFATMAICAITTSCKDDPSYTYNIGNPDLTVENSYQQAFFGDSLTYTVNVQDDIPLSTLKLQLYFTDEMVSETIIRTNNNGQYAGSLYVPYYKNVPDGVATVKFTVQNISKKVYEKEVDLPLSRPNYDQLTFVTSEKEYTMNRVGAHQYEVQDNFPFAIKGYIRAPKYGPNGNELTFGWQNNSIELGNTNEIPFSNSTSGVYTISFNTLNYEASPFIVAYAINEVIFSRIDDQKFKAELDLTQGAPIVIDGFEDLASWWIDSDYFVDDGTGQLTFNAKTGKYRVTADLDKKYFIVEAMSGNELASLNGDGSGAIWIIGEGIGKPSVQSNQVGWDPGKALCMAPMGDKKYQITIKSDETVYADYINFKFFHQKNWGGEFSNSTISTTSDLIFIGDGTNGRDPGNLGLVDENPLDEGVSYRLTIDLSDGNGNAKLTVTRL